MHWKLRRSPRHLRLGGSNPNPGRTLRPKPWNLGCRNCRQDRGRGQIKSASPRNIRPDLFALRVPGFGPPNVNAHNPKKPGTPIVRQGAMFSTCPTERSPWRFAANKSWTVEKLAGMESDEKQRCLHAGCLVWHSTV